MAASESVVSGKKRRVSLEVQSKKAAAGLASLSEIAFDKDMKFMTGVFEEDHGLRRGIVCERSASIAANLIKPNRGKRLLLQRIIHACIEQQR